MKVKTEIDLSVQMGAESTGTSLQGYMPEGTSYDDLIKVFGDPLEYDGTDGKIQAEWCGKISGLVFTIYDYKSDVEPRLNTNWHIGGKIKLAAELVKVYFGGHSACSAQFCDNYSP